MFILSDLSTNNVLRMKLNNQEKWLRACSFAYFSLMFLRRIWCTLLILKTSKWKLQQSYRKVKVSFVGVPLTERNFLSRHFTGYYSIESHAPEIGIYLLFYMLSFSGHCFATSATLAQIRAATLGTEVCYEVNREHYTLLGASSERLKLIKLVFN